jgi:hypothetical protein
MKKRDRGRANNSGTRSQVFKTVTGQRLGVVLVEPELVGIDATSLCTGLSQRVQVDRVVVVKVVHSQRLGPFERPEDDLRHHSGRQPYDPLLVRRIRCIQDLSGVFHGMDGLTVSARRRNSQAIDYSFTHSDLLARPQRRPLGTTAAKP